MIQDLLEKLKAAYDQFAAWAEKKIPDGFLAGWMIGEVVTDVLAAGVMIAAMFTVPSLGLALGLASGALFLFVHAVIAVRILSRTEQVTDLATAAA